MPPDPFAVALQEWMEVAMRGSMRRFLHYAMESGLSMSHFGALFHLHHSGSCGVTEVGEHLGVTSAAASQMLDRLVHLGLVSRAEDPDDRRVKRIELTEKGRQVIEGGIRARQEWVNDLAEALTQDEKNRLISDLETLIQKARQLTPETVETN
jgi:DNA-binding MarR family transcriptional regulator